MYKVRVYQEKDKDGVENVCVAASSRAKGKDSPWAKVILRLFCRYYIEMEPNHCVVAVNEENEVIGYVICASNYDIWKKDFSKYYLDTCEDEDTIKFGKMCIDGIEEYSKEYPAHLHINVHPNYQRMGIGNKLLEKLVDILKQESIKGLMLDVSATNEKGINFYRKCGFEEVDKKEHDIIYGMKL